MNKEETRKQIIEEYSRDNTDWERLRKLVTELGDDINDRINPEETLLSELFGNYSYQDGGKLLRLVKLFLECGYDVKANNGFNGGMCLCQLCWASYDRYILDIAKLLLDEGADPFFSLEEEEDYDVVSCISFKFGYWVVGDLECANLFEVYYDLIECAQNGEDYHDIYTAYNCMDKPLCRIEKGKYDDREDFVLWFDDMPLVISPWVDFVVNPVKAGKYAEKYDVTEDYREICGAKLKEIIYFGQCAAAIILDNGKNMVFMKNSANAEVHKAYLKVCDESECNGDITGITAEKIYVNGNKPLSYDEVYLVCGEKRYLVSSIGVDYEDHYLVCMPVDAEQMEGHDGRIKCSPAKINEILRYPDGRIRTIHLVSDKHIYLATFEYRGVKVVCSSQPVEDVWDIGYYQEIEKVKLCWGS